MKNYNLYYLILFIVSISFSCSRFEVDYLDHELLSFEKTVNLPQRVEFEIYKIGSSLCKCAFMVCTSQFEPTTRDADIKLFFQDLDISECKDFLVCIPERLRGSDIHQDTLARYIFINLILPKIKKDNSKYDVITDEEILDEKIRIVIKTPVSKSLSLWNEIHKEVNKINRKKPKPEKEVQQASINHSPPPKVYEEKKDEGIELSEIEPVVILPYHQQSFDDDSNRSTEALMKDENLERRTSQSSLKIEEKDKDSDQEGNEITKAVEIPLPNRQHNVEEDNAQLNEEMPPPVSKKKNKHQRRKEISCCTIL